MTQDYNVSYYPINFREQLFLYIFNLFNNKDTRSYAKEATALIEEIKKGFRKPFLYKINEKHS